MSALPRSLEGSCSAAILSGDRREAQFQVAIAMVLEYRTRLVGAIVERVSAATIVCSLLIGHVGIRVARSRLSRTLVSCMAILAAIVTTATRAEFEEVEIAGIGLACGAPSEAADIVEFAVGTAQFDVARNGMYSGWVDAAICTDGGRDEGHHVVCVLRWGGVVEEADLSSPDIVNPNVGLQTQSDVPGSSQPRDGQGYAADFDNHCGFGQGRSNEKPLKGGAVERWSR